jgi:hypothetical protein
MGPCPPAGIRAEQFPARVAAVASFTGLLCPAVGHNALWHTSAGSLALVQAGPADQARGNIQAKGGPLKYDGSMRNSPAQSVLDSRLSRPRKPKCNHAKRLPLFYPGLLFRHRQPVCNSSCARPSPGSGPIPTPARRQDCRERTLIPQGNGARKGLLEAREGFFAAGDSRFA